jgi:hypothetical protein
MKNYEQLVAPMNHVEEAVMLETQLDILISSIVDARVRQFGVEGLNKTISITVDENVISNYNHTNAQTMRISSNSITSTLSSRVNPNLIHDGSSKDKITVVSSDNSSSSLGKAENSIIYTEKSLSESDNPSSSEFPVHQSSEYTIENEIKETTSDDSREINNKEPSGSDLQPLEMNEDFEVHTVEKSNQVAKARPPLSYVDETEGSARTISNKMAPEETEESAFDDFFDDYPFLQRNSTGLSDPSLERRSFWDIA